MPSDTEIASDRVNALLGVLRTFNGDNDAQAALLALTLAIVCRKANIGQDDAHMLLDAGFETPFSNHRIDQ